MELSEHLKTLLRTLPERPGVYHHIDKDGVILYIGMAKNLGKEVIAEGIETEEQRELLLQMGCYYGQGYLFSPAETASRLGLLQLGNTNAVDTLRAA